MQKVDLAAIAGESAQASSLGAELPEIYQALSHEAVSRVLRDAATFSSAGVYAASMGVVMGPTILAMDPPRHIAYRKPLAPEFAQKVIAGMEGQIRTITRSILAEAAPRPDGSGSMLAMIDRGMDPSRRRRFISTVLIAAPSVPPRISKDSGALCRSTVIPVLSG